MGSAHPSPALCGCSPGQDVSRAKLGKDSATSWAFLILKTLSHVRLVVWHLETSPHVLNRVLWVFLVEGSAQFKILHQSQRWKSLPSFLFTLFSSPFHFFLLRYSDFSGGSDSKASAYNVGDPGSIPGSGRSPGEGNGNPLQYSCLENPKDGEAWVGCSPWGRRVGHDWATSLKILFILSILCYF